MSRSRSAVHAVLAAAVGLAVAAPAFGQDPTQPPPKTEEDPKKPKTDPKAPAKPPAKPPAKTTEAPPQKTTAVEDATKTMPTWDAADSTGQESVEETFFRLSRDFASTAEIGVRHLGQVPVWPRGELKFGSMRILPYLREGFEYDSNFFKVHKTGTFGEGECANQAAYTWQTQVGALGTMRFAGGRAQLTAGADSQWDVRFKDENEDLVNCEEQEDSWEFVGTVALSYTWPQGVYVRGGYIWERLVDPVDIEQTAEFPRHNHRPFVVVGMNKDIIFGSKARMEAGANMRDVVAEDSETDDVDRTEMEYYLKISYPFWKDTTRLFVRGRYRQDERESDQINDGDVWGIDFGMEGTIPFAEGESRGLRGSVSLGFDTGSYEDETFGANDELVRDENSENTSLAVNALLQYKMSPRSMLDLRYIRSNEFSFHGNYQIIDRFDLTFTRQINQNMTARIGAFWEHGDPSGRLAPQNVNVGFDTTSEYPETTRGGGGVGLRYMLNDYADFDVYYNYERNNSRVSGFSNHEAGIGITIYLNALRPRRETGGMTDAAAAGTGR